MLEYCGLDLGYSASDNGVGAAHPLKEGLKILAGASLDVFCNLFHGPVLL